MSRTIQDEDGYMINVIDLYHRTTTDAARSILRSGSFTSDCSNSTQAYFSNTADGDHGRQYGEAVVHVEVPSWAATEDERYRDGETFYRVELSELRSNRVLGAFTISPDGNRTHLKDTPRQQLAEKIATRAATLQSQTQEATQPSPSRTRAR